MSKLTPKQGRFIDAYMLSSNGAAAYREAYNAANMREASIAKEVKELLKHPLVSAEIKRRQALLAEKNIVSVESLTRALLETAEEARGRGALASMIEEAKHSGASINVTSPPLGAAVSAYRIIAQLHGLLTDKREATGASQLIMNIHTESTPRLAASASRTQTELLPPSACNQRVLVMPPPVAVATAPDERCSAMQFARSRAEDDEAAD